MNKQNAMKYYKAPALSIIIIAIATVICSFAIPGKAAQAIRYFRFSSSAAYNLANLQNPANWTLVASPVSDHAPGRVDEIAIISNPGNLYTYPAGSPLAGKPRVDGSNTSLTNDLVVAYNSGCSSAVEVFQTDYQILSSGTCP